MLVDRIYQIKTLNADKRKKIKYFKDEMNISEIYSTTKEENL